MSARDDHVDVGTWFSLSYCAYLAVNRSLLQSMPLDWQYRFVDLLDELWAQFPDIDEPIYTVHARDAAGRFIKDPIPHYNRGRTFIPGTTPIDQLSGEAIDKVAP